MHQRLTHNDYLKVFSLHISAWIVLGLFCTTLTPIESKADEKEPGPSHPFSWQINADRIQYQQNTDEYTAEGHVRVTREGRTLTADMIRLNQTSHQAWAEGNVRLISGKDVLTAKSLEINLDSETGTISNGTLFFSENHMYLSGKTIRKTGPDTYQIKKADVTSCDGPHPAWHISGNDLEVTIEGYGYAKNAALWAKRIPVIYTPYIVFPVKLKRQSGLLMPEFGVSDRKGTEYLQPLYWAINENMDATVFADYMSERGTRWGGEYRYAAGERARGTLMADGFNDRQVDNGQDENSKKWGYADDQYLRPNRDRYWFRAKIDQNLPWQMTAKLDLDVVSDQDYLKEFQEGFNGFDQTRTYFLKTYGRDVEDFTNPIRLNQLNINRLWTGYTLNADARWYDDVVKRRLEDTQDTLQQLPAVTLDGTKKKIAGSPFYFDLLSGYTNFYREDGDRGQRADLYPRVYYPFRLFKAVSIEPSAGIRQTAWHIDHYETPPDGAKNDFYRAIYDLKLDTSTDFYRVYNVAVAGCDRIKHSLKPQIVYEYTPEQDQGEYPQFDALDRIEARNLITYSLTNNLIARKPHNMVGQSNDPAYGYIPFLRFKLAQSFDINKYNKEHGAETESTRENKPFSDILAELDITPGRYVILDADARWSPYDGEFYGYNAAVQLSDLRGDRIGMDYRFTRETVEAIGVQSINIIGALQVTRRWRLRGKYERDIESSRIIETGVGITYNAQCWGLDLDYKEEVENKSIAVMVHLTGLGSVGQ